MQMPLTPLLRCLNNWWNGQGWNPTTNPGGMANDGHAQNLVATTANNGICVVGDIASLVQQAGQSAQIAASCAAGSNGYMTIVGVTYAMVSANQFTASVSPAADLTPFFEINRAIEVTQTKSGNGYISASSYSAATGLTTVTVTGITLDSGFQSIVLGQAVENAPLQTPPSGNNLYLANNYSGLIY
jgi:hypothetical protein